MPKNVQIEAERISGWDSFHDTFVETLGFPDFYGRNMDAWIDCMTCLDDPDAGMTSTHVSRGDVMVLCVSDVGAFKRRCPEIYDALVECSAFVNYRRIETGEPAVLALSFNFERNDHMRIPIVILIGLVLAAPLAAQTRPRGRELGIPFPGKTGPNNAITDVAGIAVGHVTLIEGEGKLIPGKGPIRTGVTAILPRPKGNWDPVFAATFNLNGNGDMTGINWIKESGFMEGPILLTGTHSVGTVRDAAIQWQLKNGRKFIFTYPIVAETFDFLNDANGEHVKPMHALQALDNAKPGRVQEGAVGGGTGMGCNGFKGGIGTSSRVLESGGYTIGVLVQCNYGGDLRILGVPMRQEIGDLRACTTLPQPLTREWTRGMPLCSSDRGANDTPAAQAYEGRGSIIIIVATDAPLLPHQLERLTRRVGMGLGRLGSWAGNSSGDLFLAFSTANAGAGSPEGTPSLKMLPNDQIDPLFRATIDATEEAVVNAMLAAETMTGADGIRLFGLPGDRVVAALKKYNRMK